MNKSQPYLYLIEQLTVVTEKVVKNEQKNNQKTKTGKN